MTQPLPTSPLPEPQPGAGPAAQGAADEGAGWAERTEQLVLDAALPLAADLGWTRQLVHRAGALAGLSPADTDLLLPEGPRDLAALLAARHDAVALRELGALDPGALKVRQRVRAAVLARLEAAAADGAATRGWMGFLSLPPNAPLGLRLCWTTADLLWRWAGDEATDENHYTKRTLLGGILLTALPIRLERGVHAAETYVDARIDNVMAFETWKRKLPPPDRLRRAAETLGRLRYGRG